MKKLVVLISGEGSNLQAIIDAIDNKQLKASIAAVISNKKNAPGLAKAQQAHIPTHVLTQQDCPTRKAYDRQLQALIEQHQPNLVVLAGYMRILSTEFVEHFHGKLINIHPSLLPAYPGLNTHERVLTTGEPIHGTTVHFVTEEVDGGPIIAQAHCSVTKNDTVHSLTKKIKSLEHQLFPEVIQWFIADRLRLSLKEATLDGRPLTKQGIQVDL